MRSTKSKHLAYNSSRVQPNILRENQLLVFGEVVEHTVVVEDSHSLVEEDTLVEDNLVKGNLVVDKHLSEDTLQLKKTQDSDSTRKKKKKNQNPRKQEVSSTLWGRNTDWRLLLMIVVAHVNDKTVCWNWKRVCDVERERSRIFFYRWRTCEGKFLGAFENKYLNSIEETKTRWKFATNFDKCFVALFLHYSRHFFFIKFKRPL